MELTEEQRQARREYMKNYRLTHPKPVRSAEYKARQAAKKRERYQNDPEYKEKRKAIAYKWRDANPEKAKSAAKLFHEKNPGYSTNYNREYVRNRKLYDIEFYNSCLNNQRLWRLRNWQKNENLGILIKNKEELVIDQEIIKRLEAWQVGRCYFCNAKGRLTTEHIIPRKLGGPTIPQNLVRTCEHCNYSRQEKLFYLQWVPQNREIIFDEFLVCKDQIKNDLIYAGFGVEVKDDSFVLKSDYTTKILYIISTFMASDRNIENNYCIANLLQQNSDSIVILDREWYSRKSAILNMLRSKLHIMNKGLGARQLDAVNLSQTQCDEFMNRNHVMGAIQEKIRIGLVKDDKIYGVGLFSETDNFFECNRLAFDGHVPGGMSKIITYLKRNYGTKPIISYIDTRYATGDGHAEIGFSLLGKARVTYKWILPDRTQHQRYLSNLNKMSMNLLCVDLEKSREDNIKANGIFKLWMPEKLKMIME